MRKLAFLVPLALTACAVGPNYVKPETKVADQFGNFNAAAFTQDQAVTKFWSLFSDDILDSLVTDALAANLDLRIALSRFNEARASRRESKFNLFPTVTASAGYTKQHVTQEQAVLLPSRSETFYDAGFDAIWELDLFGRVRRGIEATSATSRERRSQPARRAGHRRSRSGANLSGTARPARPPGRGAKECREPARVAESRGRTARRRSRHGAGHLARTGAAQHHARQHRRRSKRQVASSIHRLSVLTGRQPIELRDRLIAPRDLPAVPAVAAVGNPTDLLRRRPDIRVAERNLAARHRAHWRGGG